VRSFVAALQFLTVFPWPRRAQRGAEEIGPAVSFFPVVGLLLGLVLVLVDFSLQPIASRSLSSVALISTLAFLTRALHLDGLGDTFDGLGAGGERERMLRIMDDSHAGVFGVVAIVLLLFFKIHALEAIDHERWRALIAAPVLGRWSMAVLGYGSAPAKPGLGSTLMEHLQFKHFLFASLTALIIAAVVLREMGVLLMIAIAIFSLAAKKYFHRRLGGVTGDTFGAVGELSETAVLIAVALGAR